MKLRDYLASLESFVDDPDSDPVRWIDGLKAVRNLMDWSKQANEALIRVEAGYSEDLSDGLLRIVSSLIDTEVS